MTEVTLMGFLHAVSEDERIARDLGELAARHGFRIVTELSDHELDGVSGGTSIHQAKQQAKGEALSTSPTTAERDQAFTAFTTSVTAAIVNAYVPDLDSTGSASPTPDSTVGIRPPIGPST